jgi:hypothetical protein
MDIKIIKSVDTPRGKLFEVKVNKKVIRVVLTWHALEGADDYNFSASELLNFLISPEEVIRGHVNRFIAHKRLNRHLTRVIYEYENKTIIVIAFYISHVNRYFRGGIYEDKILP